MDYENKIIDAIEQIVNNAVDQAKYDRTIKATILECVDQTAGKFKVKHQDSVFYAYTTSSGITYPKNSEVYVLIPENDTTRDKTILGSIKKIETDSTIVDPSNDYEAVGSNCIYSSSTFELCSYRDEEVVLYEKDGEYSDIVLDTEAVKRYFTQSPSLICGAIFRTHLPLEQQFRGNYGIKFELVFLDNSTKQNVTRSYTVDVNQMTGNPYQFTSDTKQSGVFDIDGANFQYVNKISIFVAGFPVQDSSKSADIFIKNIDFYGAVKLTDKELNEYSMSIVTPNGSYFDDNDSSQSTKELQAQVRIKGQIVDKTSQLLKYYWFVENASITALSEHYNQYGGPGWYCLNLNTIVKPAEGGNAPIVQWVSGSYNLTIRKSDLIAKNVKYKCVAIYNDTTVISKEIDIANYSSNVDITIESTSGTAFYYDIGNPTLICKINGEERTSGVTYFWAEVDNNNNYVELDETTALNNDYNYNKNAYDTLLAEIQNESKLYEANREQLEYYETILKNYDIITRVEGNRIFNVNISQITNYKTFKVSVYISGVYQGTASIILTNNLDNKDACSLIINNGSQIFNYDTNGISPANQAQDFPQKILPLSFTIYDNLGNPLSDDIIQQSDIKWTIPKTETMLIVDDSKYAEYKIAEDDDSVTYKNLLSIDYSILDRYVMDYLNNSIKLTVDYKGISLTDQTHFTFAKDGKPGLNGTEFMVKVAPNTADDSDVQHLTIVNSKPVFEVKEESKWVKVQLWHNGYKIFEGTESGSSSEEKPVEVIWSMLANKYNDSTSDQSTVSINATTGACRMGIFNMSNSPANIVKCTVIYDDVKYYATLPIITATVDAGYSVKLKDNTGFKHVYYDSEGCNPCYNDAEPFELQVTQNINGYIEDISELTKDYAVDYVWDVCGRLFNGAWIPVKHLLTDARADVKRNAKAFKPDDFYNDESVNNALCCTIFRGDDTIAQVHIPVHLLSNKSNHLISDEWDGNSIPLTSSGGIILVPQTGAGNQETDGSFTGVIMSKAKEVNGTSYDVGLLGYNHGKRSLFLDAETGSAIFGKQGNGQICIDAVEDRTLLYSPDFWREYENGKPKNYSEDNYNNAGMLIDLTNSEIRFGNGKVINQNTNTINTKSTIGKTVDFNIDDKNGGIHKMSFVNGILMSYDYVPPVNGQE